MTENEGEKILPAGEPVVPPESEGTPPEGGEANKGLQTALHKERQARKEAEKATVEAKAALEAAKAQHAPSEVIERLAKVEEQLAKEQALRPFVAELGDPVLAESAFSYFEKLSTGVTDEAAKTEMRKRAINLALMDKNPNASPMDRVTGSMHSSSSSSSNASGIQPSTVEMAKSLGINPDKLKEANRPISNLYNR